MDMRPPSWLVLLAASACSSGDQAPSEDTSQAVGVLPVLATDGQCLEAPPTPSLCDWSGSVDRVLIGEVLSVSPVVDPFVRSNSGQNPVLVETGSCDGTLLIGVKITVRAVEWMGGAAEDSPTADVYVGATQAVTWSPIPGHNPSTPETIEWVGAEAGAEPFATGMVIGLPVTHVDGRWSLQGENPFAVESERIRLPPTGECSTGFPAIDGEELEAVKTAIEACSSSPSAGATARRQSREQYWDSAEDTFAASCSIAEHPEACESNEQCNEHERCEEGRCVDVPGTVCDGNVCTPTN